MQKIIVISIAVSAFVYLLIKFIAKNKSHDCDNCGISDNKIKDH